MGELLDPNEVEKTLKAHPDAKAVYMQQQRHQRGTASSEGSSDHRKKLSQHPDGC
jgi:hypothetical protein